MRRFLVPTAVLVATIGVVLVPPAANANDYTVSGCPTSIAPWGLDVSAAYPDAGQAQNQPHPGLHWHPENCGDSVRPALVVSKAVPLILPAISMTANSTATALLNLPEPLRYYGGSISWSGQLAAHQSLPAPPVSGSPYAAESSVLMEGITDRRARVDLVARSRIYIPYSPAAQASSAQWGSIDPTGARAAEGRPVTAPLASGEFQQLQLTVACDSAYTLQCKAATVGIENLTLNVHDPAPPTVTVSGLPAPASVVKGQLTVHVDATDQGAGVQRIELLAAGKVVATKQPADVSAMCPQDTRTAYSNIQPCPATASADLDVDTTTLPDGPVTLEARAVDASGSVSTPSGGTASALTVDNLTPAREDIKAAGLSTSPPCGIDAAGRWFNPDAADTGAALPSSTLTGDITYTVLGKKPKRGKRIRITRTARAHTYNWHGTAHLTGRLTGADGAPVANATVRLALRRPGLAWSLCGAPTATTQADGTWTADVAKADANLEVLALHFPNPTTNQVLSSQTLQLNVRGDVQLLVRKKGRRVTFAGAVQGDPKADALVLLQVRSGGKWREFTKARADADGNYTARWIFPRGKSRRYSIRAVTPAVGSRPYATGRSRERILRLR